jgi:glycosyltransferase involved in cell wall biosynthesis
MTMRLGVVWESNNNAHYRAIDPMRAMERRGHEVVWPADGKGRPDLMRLGGCDVVHVYRRCEQNTLDVLARLARSGTAITWDTDDDLTAIPKESPVYSRTGGLTARRIFAQTVKAAKLARSVTTTNELLASKYRRAGVERVDVIGNYLAPKVSRPRRRHDGVVIGWIAGLEHRADVARIPVADALRRLMAEHQGVRVECIGVDLNLRERYRHDARVPFRELPRRMAAWDIGIAPLANIPINRTRSDIKLKEYAASRVVWLASPVGPYAGLGEEQGGRLVPDDGWFEALERLVTQRRERRRLARHGRAWAKRQTVDAVADRWEEAFVNAARLVVARH